MISAIAIVGMACRYPDAQSPTELWENSLAQRRAFRRLPPERLRLEDYFSTDRRSSDTIYSTEAALIEGYEFDRVRFRIAGSTFRSADLAHWLALDVASQALADAGFPDATCLNREAAGVILGNTLTGEVSRANMLRLRWPYVRRTLEPLLIKEGYSPQKRRLFFEEFETAFKQPFPLISEETLAGGLSNTIAGRICNHFDLKGGGYTIDGACASSLLAITTACSALAAGDLDVALAGGVDLSLDPFELVGFSRTAALATDEMRVYDARANGFWPGEGCGFAVLMRHEDALTQGRRVYATIRGWGVSSDGSGSITRPEVEGQLLAIERAYTRAGFGVDTVTYFEGHGTGTSVGDATELRTLSRVRRQTAPTGPPAFISSIKANIGHTKAAAGIAGLIRATMALHSQIVPPATACEHPHSELTGESPALVTLREAIAWPADRLLRAAVSAMGFGGINTHVVLEEPASTRRTALDASERATIASPQDAELFLFDARNQEDLQQQVEQVLALAARLSRAELADVAATIERALEGRQWRGAVVARTPADLAQKLATLRSWLMDGVAARLDPLAGIYLGSSEATPRLGFLFPGQGSPSHLTGGAMCRRFELVRQIYTQAGLPEADDEKATEIAQPAILTASLAALRLLDRLGLRGSIAVGHSLGEIAALHWAGAFDERALLRIAFARGKAMTNLQAPAGAMASINAGRQKVEASLNGKPVVIAGLNSPVQTVISGDAAAVADMIAHFNAMGITAVGLPVSHAFHSPYVEAAAPLLRDHLRREAFFPLRGKVISTVTGGLLESTCDLQTLLYRQITQPVRFLDAVTEAAKAVDLFIEVGPGQVLSRMIGDHLSMPVIALDAGGPSLEGLLQAIGAAFALGARINHAALFAGRFLKPIDLKKRPRFIVNPCESAPTDDYAPSNFSEPDELLPTATPPAAESIAPPPGAQNGGSRSSATAVLDQVRHLVAQRAELPAEIVRDEDRLLRDLHLNSISVSQLVLEAARRLDLSPPVAFTNFADATVADIAQVLEAQSPADKSTDAEREKRTPAGLDSWIRAFTVEMIESPLPKRPRQVVAGACRVIMPPDHLLGRHLEAAFKDWPDGGVIVVCLPPNPDERHIDLLLEGAQAVLDQPEPTKFVLLQHGSGATAFAKTLHLERPGLTTCIIDVPPSPSSLGFILDEIRAARGFTEAHYDVSGTRREPVLRFLDLKAHDDTLPLDSSDVLLVTGGGKGITFECALSLARQTGVRLVLLGLSLPDADAELSDNLERMTAERIRFTYLSADVTDGAAVRAALAGVEKPFARVTAILHGAALNAPQALGSIDRETMQRTIATKIDGARNLLAAVDRSRLKAFIAFGSIIARTGLPGEAHYGLANEWLTRLTEQLQNELPACRCLAVEWSVWSGAGMAQRIGGIEKLIQAGITPITVDEGVSILHRLLENPPAAPAVVVTGRYADLETLRIERPELPLSRFLEIPRVYYPGIELISDSEISVDSDPYLADHFFEGERIFPAVMALEAMTQVAMALIGSSELPSCDNVRFLRSLVVPAGETIILRGVALVKQGRSVEVALRSSVTAFQIDHFRATLNFPEPLCTREPVASAIGVSVHSAYLPIEPDTDLYGGTLFQTGRFQRLLGYQKLLAKECLAEIASDGEWNWFGRYLPEALALGDPGQRDAAIHAIQACIPHRTLLPVGIDKLEFSCSDAALEAPASVFVHARERDNDGDNFTYDVAVMEGQGKLLERWEGLRLRAVGSAHTPDAWPEPLLGPYLERRINELAGAEVSVVLNFDLQGERRARTDRAIRQALGRFVPVYRRFDGKPVVAAEVTVSATHTGNLTLAVAGDGPLACDAEAVTPRTAGMWHELLGGERLELAELITRDNQETLGAAATRVWTAIESLKKAGRSTDTPLALESIQPGGWVLLSAGEMTIATLVARVKKEPSPVAIALLVKRVYASL